MSEPAPERTKKLLSIRCGICGAEGTGLGVICEHLSVRLPESAVTGVPPTREDSE